jgi:hypothetical protein
MQLAARRRRTRGAKFNPGATPAPVNMLALIPEEFLSAGCEAPATQVAFLQAH